MKQVPMTAFKARRTKLIEKIGNAILILPAATEKTRNRDCHYTFRQDSDFLYLSHFNEPDAIMVLDGKNKKSILFSKPYDKAFYLANLMTNYTLFGKAILSGKSEQKKTIYLTRLTP